MNGSLIAWRRAFHRIPEPGMELPATHWTVLNALKGLAIEGHQVGHTWGVLAEVKGCRPGGTLLLRSDMDALPIREETGLDFASDSGNMHACGHDAHMAMLLGAARLIGEHRRELQGTVRFLFQPGEEISQGAEALIAEGVLEGVDAACGLHIGHIFPELAPGEIGVHRGTAMASMDRFLVRFRGQGTHGAAPERGVDPIVMAGQFLSVVQTLASREISPVKPVVVTVGRIQAGTAYNIIPGVAELEGTFRTVTPEDRERVSRRIREMAEGLAVTMGGSCEVEMTFGAAPVVNDPDSVREFLDVTSRFFGEGMVRELSLPTMVGEDMSAYLERVPGLFFFLGAGKGDGNDFPHHHAKFDISEDVLWRGSAALAAFALGGKWS
jgi:amidohydrolase